MKNRNKTLRGGRKERSLNRFNKRIFLPTFVAGFCALVLFFVFARDDDRKATPDVAASGYFAESNNSEPNNYDASPRQVPNRALLASLEPQRQILSQKIAALESANTDTLAERRDELVQAWETFDATYQAISDSLRNK